MLALQCPEVLGDMFGSDPTPGWLTSLGLQAAQLAGSRSSASWQLFYGYLKDLIDHWNALLDALLADDGVMLPDVAAFPKHLLLGALAAPREQRTGLYPSPLDASARQQSARSRFLVWKFGALINAFALPTDTVVRVTPSLGDAQPLEDRAIPWHYSTATNPPIQVAWNFKRSAHKREGENLGYRSSGWATSPRARDPLGFAIGGFDFFRIEGQLGRQVEAVGDELRALIAARNLPLHVQEVLLHNERRFIKRRPPIRYTPLHSLHYLMRQDVSLRLDESLTFGTSHLADMSKAVASTQVPAITDSGADVIGLAGSAMTAVTNIQAIAKPVLSQSSHSGYKAQIAGNGSGWRASYATGLQAVGNARASLGHVSRTDFASPYDSLLHINQPHWIDWLDDLIQAHDERADDKLMFTRFVQDHPGLDHLGGAWRGGTFVLVYDDSGRVVADFTLPYPAAEVVVPEPVEPPLRPPIFRPPIVVTGGLRVLRPVDLKVSDRVLIERQSFKNDLEQQSARIQGLVQGVFVPNNAVAPKRVAVPGLAELPGMVADGGYLAFNAKAMEDSRIRVQDLQDMVTQPELPAETRVLVERDLAKAQTDLATAVATVTEHVVSSKLDPASDAGLALTSQLTRSVSVIQSPQAKSQLDNQFTSISTGPGVGAGVGSVLIGNLRRVGGIGNIG
jgi:hypothetical protein